MIHSVGPTFELWCWKRLLRVPWIATRSKLSILKLINPEYSLEGLMRKLELQQFGHLMQRADSMLKTLMLEKIEGRRRKGKINPTGVERTLESSLDCKEIQPVHPKGNQS